MPLWNQFGRVAAYYPVICVCVCVYCTVQSKTVLLCAVQYTHTLRCTVHYTRTHITLHSALHTHTNK